MVIFLTTGGGPTRTRMCTNNCSTAPVRGGKASPSDDDAGIVMENPSAPLSRGTHIHIGFTGEHLRLSKPTSSVCHQPCSHLRFPSRARGGQMLVFFFLCLLRWQLRPHQCYECELPRSHQDDSGTFLHSVTLIPSTGTTCVSPMVRSHFQEQGHRSAG